MALRKRWITLILLVVVVVALALWGHHRWRHAKVHVGTENAYVRGKLHMVASRVPGTLLQVAAEENREVAAGEVLATLDPKDFDVGVERAEASLAEAEAGLATDRAQIAQAKAQVEAALGQASLAGTELARMEALFRRESLPKQRYDQAASAKVVADAQVEAARKAASALEAKLGVSGRKVEVARAALEEARLRRSYCTVRAPVAGVVSRKSAEPGTVVASGQPLCAVVPLGLPEIWVEANYKETQLKGVKPGQRATVRADVDPSVVYTARVDSLSAGTGAAFSLLPPENATGNWVKVVQRLPVKIVLDPDQDADHRLRVGMTVSVEIDTTSR